MIRTKQSQSDSGQPVYDISLDGTVVNALGMNIVSNTDGFNFQMPSPDKFRYTEEHPYISNGKGRNSKEGAAYTGIDADVAEFEDTYLCPPYTTDKSKMGLGIDEFCPATINFARKNYADLLENGSVKLVGNSIKSKKMPVYIEKFLDKAIPMLLHAQGREFLDFYYDYIEKIFNMKIPLRDIASVGKIKTTIAAYQDACKRLTASGGRKARQAWYELAIKDGLDVNMGDTIYYINTGKKKNTPDVQRVSVYFVIRNGVRYENVVDETGAEVLDRRGNSMTYSKYIKNNFARYKKTDEYKRMQLNELDYAKSIIPDIKVEDRVNFECVRLDTAIVEDEDEHYCDDNLEYNRDKYIDMFNKRITPLLVCFATEMRMTTNEKGQEVSNILITNPTDRKSFTDEECKLTAGQPYATSDQDTYEALMTPEDKEIRFWLSIGLVPPYAKECGIDWDALVADYQQRMKELAEGEVATEAALYQKIVDKFSQEDYNSLVEEGKLPEALFQFADEDPATNSFISRKYGIKLGTIFDFLDKDFSIDTPDE